MSNLITEYKFIGAEGTFFKKEDVEKLLGKPSDKIAVIILKRLLDALTFEMTRSGRLVTFLRHPSLWIAYGEAKTYINTRVGCLTLKLIIVAKIGIRTASNPILLPTPLLLSKFLLLAFL